MSFSSPGVQLKSQFNFTNTDPIDGRYIIKSEKEYTSMMTSSVLYAGLTFAVTTDLNIDDVTVGQGIYRVDTDGSTIIREGSYAHFSIPTQAGWYRIAVSPKDITTCFGTFRIHGKSQGIHTSALIEAGTTFGSGSTPSSISLNAFHCNQFHNTKGLTKARIVYPKQGYNNHYNYLELYHDPGNYSLETTIHLYGLCGWILVSPTTSSSIPEGYLSKEITLSSNTISTTGGITTASGISNERIDSEPAQVVVSNTNGSVELLVHTNRGLYDRTTEKWMVVANANDNTVTLNGNSTTATALATARTISLTGDVTGSVAFDGQSNVDIATTVTDDSHNHTIENVDGLQTAINGKAPTSHASTDTTYGAATTTTYGHVKLYTADYCTTCEADDGALTPSAVRKYVQSRLEWKSYNIN